MVLAAYSPQVLLIICVLFFNVNCGAEAVLKIWFNPVKNSNSSVRYLLFTQRNPEESCVLEPTQESLKRCYLNPEKETIILIHGYTIELTPNNRFYVMKDKLLEIDQYNIIALDWDKYSGSPYISAVSNAYIVAARVAEMVNFLKKNAGIKPEDVCIIGHSLGAQLAGVAGRKIPNLGKIIGLDPAGPGFVLTRNKLSYKDAAFVQVIHTSSFEHRKSFGLSQPMGHMDFYVNGGTEQPGCQTGKEFEYASGNTATVNNPFRHSQCNHNIVLDYFMQSFNKTGCQFKGTLCKSYKAFLRGKCIPPKSVDAEMGFFADKLPGLPPHSKFYLRTSDSPPYCLADGFLPKIRKRNTSYRKIIRN